MAEVEVELEPHGDDRFPTRSSSWVTTDERGHYRVDYVHVGWKGVVTAKVSSTYAVRSAPQEAGREPLRVDFRLPPPATLCLRLSAATAELPRASTVYIDGEITASSQVRDDTRDASEPFRPVSTWNPHGREKAPWLLREEAGGRVLTVQASPGRLAVYIEPEEAPLVVRYATLVAGETLEVACAIATDGVVRGRVITPQGWKPSGGTVEWDGDRTMLVGLRQDHTFRVLGTGKGRGRLKIRAGFAGGHHREVEVENVLPGGEPVEFRVPGWVPPSVIHGRVSGPPKGLGHVYGIVHARDGPRGGRLKLDDEGRFTFPYFSQGPAMFVVDAEDLAPVCIEIPRLVAGDRRFVGDIRLGHGVELVGRVRDGAGVPLPKVEVALADSWRADFSPRPVQTDADGVFRMPRLPEGPVLLSFWVKGFPQHLFHVDTRATLSPEVVLRPGGKVDVEVVDTEGRPVRSARLEVWPASDLPYGIDRNALQRFRDLGDEARASPWLSSGTHVFRAHGPQLHPRSRPVEVVVREGETTKVTLVLR
jgi:hypothetical protein